MRTFYPSFLYKYFPNEDHPPELILAIQNDTKRKVARSLGLDDISPFTNPREKKNKKKVEPITHSFPCAFPTTITSKIALPSNKVEGTDTMASTDSSDKKPVPTEDLMACRYCDEKFTSQTMLAHHISYRACPRTQDQEKRQYYDDFQARLTTLLGSYRLYNDDDLDPHVETVARCGFLLHPLRSGDGYPKIHCPRCDSRVLDLADSYYDSDDVVLDLIRAHYETNKKCPFLIQAVRFDVEIRRIREILIICDEKDTLEIKTDILQKKLKMASPRSP